MTDLKVLLKSFTPAQFPPKEFGSINSAIKALGESGWPLWASEFPDDGLPLANAIVQGTAIAVTDGSFNYKLSAQLGTASWIIFDPQQSTFVKGWVQTSTSTDGVDPYRSEFQGIHTIVLALKILCQVHKITQGSVTLYCNNINGIRRASDSFLELPPTTKQADIIRAIRRITHNLPINIIFEHVKGHQDNTQYSLTIPETLNCIMDADAKQALSLLAHLRAQGHPVQPKTHLHGEGV